METSAATMEKSVGDSSKKLKSELPYDQAVLLLGIYLVIYLNWKGRIAALFTIAKTWKQSKCPLMDGWIQKRWDIHMSRPRDYHTKGSKSERQRQTPSDAIYMWRVWDMIQMKLPTKQKQTHRHGGQTCACQRAGGWKGRTGRLGLADANS